MNNITQFPEQDNDHSTREAHKARIRAILEDCSPKEVNFEEELSKLVHAVARLSRVMRVTRNARMRGNNQGGVSHEKPE